MEILDCIAAVARPIHDFGDEFMADAETAAVGVEAGFQPGRGFYCRGRFGVLGEAPVAVVQAAQGFLGPALVATGWSAGRRVMPVDDAVACYSHAMERWAGAHLRTSVDVEHFNQLAQRLIDAADADALPLFAGWRARPLPADPVAAAMQRIHVLREHRGACHLTAVRACGLTAHQAMVINLGAEQAAHYGWDPPHDRTAGLVARWTRAEDLTTAMQAPLYATLTPRQRTAFAELVGGITASRSRAWPIGDDVGAGTVFPDHVASRTS
ncbi:hypothetical protein HS041_03105 [Planomonospora sp. ID67723]|uniref:SCO6745 family protein n=1 Tax=Planomonospora sp. ID67723 TaxID=2738134 RepID=UPI0018C38F44|nr:hypothetical protein [Planomonospora sp. ID67723]MBG0826764.1 hypothetical protein [Planomonospora sp. ID67723]